MYCQNKEKVRELEDNLRIWPQTSMWTNQIQIQDRSFDILLVLQIKSALGPQNWAILQDSDAQRKVAVLAQLL